jgi:hypothetical protein
MSEINTLADTLALAPETKSPRCFTPSWPKRRRDFRVRRAATLVLVNRYGSRLPGLADTV